jgi:hypothetical protein
MWVYAVKSGRAKIDDVPDIYRDVVRKILGEDNEI